MVRFHFSALLLLMPFLAAAQFSYTLDQSIPVQDASGKDLNLAWMGGMNATQFNTMDINGDGIDDLVLFDRMANKVITLLNVGNRWVHHPEFEALFPSAVTNFLLLRDYNCDGKKDIFTSDALGIKVYKNTTLPGQPLSWEQYLFTPLSGPKKPVILTYGSDPTFKVNLQIQFDDLPAIVDADNDGDLDIFNVRYMGHTVEFHRNYSVENGWGCDSLEYRRETNTWGNFSECSCGVVALNGEPCPTSAHGRQKHAGGKALLAIDANGDQNLDLIFSEAECNDLVLLPNVGSLDAPVINSYGPFPPDNPASYEIFPAGFYEDVDFDGVRDLVSSPNIFSREFATTDLESSSWFFRNEGTDANPSFVYVKNNFLQDEMIDVGDNAVPAFADFDGDGDLDMFISRYVDATAPSLSSTILHFENVGTPTSPSFRLVNKDFRPFAATGLYNIRIHFADLNGDGTTDLAFTATASDGDDRTDNDKTSLFFMANPSQSGIELDGQPLHQIAFTLLSVENLSFADINADGRADILAGRNDGSIEYWRNDGGTPLPVFTLADDEFLGSGPSLFRQNAVCIVDDLNADGRADFAYSDLNGKITIISDYAGGTDTPHRTDLVFNPLLKANTEYNFGGRIWPVAANLYGTDKPLIVIGNSLGGLHVLRNQGEFAVFPNPVQKGSAINIVMDETATLFVYSSSGQLIGGPVQVEGADTFSVAGMAPGLYILRFVTSRGSVVRKIVVR